MKRPPGAGHGHIVILTFCPGQHRLKLKLKKTAAKGKNEEGESGALRAGLTPSAGKMPGLLQSYSRDIKNARLLSKKAPSFDQKAVTLEQNALNLNQDAFELESKSCGFRAKSSDVRLKSCDLKPKSFELESKGF